MKIRLRFQAMQKLLLFVVLNFLFTSVLHAKTFVFLGDSLTEGYGVAQSASFPHLIQKKVSLFFFFLRKNCWFSCFKRKKSKKNFGDGFRVGSKEQAKSDFGSAAC